MSERDVMIHKSGIEVIVRDWVPVGHVWNLPQGLTRGSDGGRVKAILCNPEQETWIWKVLDEMKVEGPKKSEDQGFEEMYYSELLGEEPKE